MNTANLETHIDFVITWVDGNDPQWQAEKQRYAAADTLGDQRDLRFRDWGTLRFWFRGVEKFAPWVNKIYFVTWGHTPKWLNLEHPKLVIVNHKDYIPPEYLPTFNSHTIEMNLHRISGLSEQFVYFNDDMFLISAVRPEDFFIDGKPKDTFALNAIYFGKDSVGLINGCNLSVINDHFSKKVAFIHNWPKWLTPVNGLKNVIRTLLLLPWPWFPGFLYSHTATNFLKSTFDVIWEKEPELLQHTCQDRFRKPTNVNQWLFKYWQLAEGNFVPCSSRIQHCFHIKSSVDETCKSIEQQKYKILCVNDTGKTTEFEDKVQKVQAAFYKILPDRSSYEKGGET